MPRFSVGNARSIVVPPKLAWVFPDNIGTPAGGAGAGMAALDTEDLTNY